MPRLRDCSRLVCGRPTVEGGIGTAGNSMRSACAGSAVLREKLSTATATASPLLSSVSRQPFIDAMNDGMAQNFGNDAAALPVVMTWMPWREHAVDRPLVIA